MLQNIEISVESNYIYVLILNLAADLACNFRGAQNGTWGLGSILSPPRGSWAHPQKPTHSELFAA